MKKERPSVPIRSIQYQLNLTGAIQVVDREKDLIPGEVRTEVHDLINSAFGTVCLQPHANIVDDRCHVHGHPSLGEIWNRRMVGEWGLGKNAYEYLTNKGKLRAMGTLLRLWTRLTFQR